MTTKHPFNGWMDGASCISQSAENYFLGGFVSVNSTPVYSSSTCLHCGSLFHQDCGEWSGAGGGGGGWAAAVINH